MSRSDRLQAIRKEMAAIHVRLMSSMVQEERTAACARFSALSVEGAELVNEAAREVGKRTGIRPRTISAGHFQKTFRIGLR